VNKKLPKWLEALESQEAREPKNDNEKGESKAHEGKELLKDLMAKKLKGEKLKKERGY
jgi:hypothetical protein